MEGTKDLASINTLDLPEAAEGSATPSSPAKSTTRTPALKKVGLTPVTEAELFSFLFPEGPERPGVARRDSVRHTLALDTYRERRRRVCAGLR